MPKHEGKSTQGFPCWADVSSPDMDAAQSFYSAVLGWEFRQTGEEYGGYRMAIRNGEQAAGLGPTQEGAPAAWTLYFAADDVDEMTARAKELGATVVAEPFEVPGQGRMSILTDPTGASFGLWQSLGHDGFGVMEEPGFFAWCELNTWDVEAANEFYGQLFGATSSKTPGTLTTYYVLEMDAHHIGGLQQMSERWQGVSPHWMPYFQAEDTDAAVERAKAHGGTVVLQPTDSPYGRLAILVDPANAAFTVIQQGSRP